MQRIYVDILRSTKGYDLAWMNFPRRHVPASCYNYHNMHQRPTDVKVSLAKKFGNKSENRKRQSSGKQRE